MVRPLRTINAALLTGFLAIFTVWLASTSYITARLTESQTRNSAIHSGFARGQQLLFTIRTQVLLGSIYVRDALIDSDERTAQAARDQVRTLRADVARELGQYRATVDARVEPADWQRLENEVGDYWDTAVQLVAESPEAPVTSAHTVLRTQVIPKRDAIDRLSDEIRHFIADAGEREKQALADSNEQVRRRFWATTAAAVGFGVAVALLATWYVGRLEGKIQEDHAEVLRNKQQLQRLSGRLTRAQEDERRAIARELHDEIGQALTAVDFEIAAAQRSVGTDERAAAPLAEARSVTRRALAGVRDLSQLLRPSMLDDFGLPDTLKWYLRKFSDRTGIRTELIGNGSTERLPIDLEVCAYRTIQEALTNVSRHAEARACRVFVQHLSS